jgi:2-hydroxychromene-2-carboxylate isomerase
MDRTVKTIDYYLAASSPWTYLGHQRLIEIAARHGAEVNLMPIDLGGKVFPTSGGLPLGQRAPQRQAYRLVELRRWANHLQVPLNVQPRHFPTPGHDAARLIILARQLHGNPAALSLAYGIMHALWAKDRDIGDAATLVELADACSLPGQQLVKSLADADFTYAENTQRALDAQVFGAPWYTYLGEPFWGQDRLDFLDRALAAAA